MADKILVRGVNWIGDAVMTIPALALLRKAYPGSPITLLVKPSVAQLFEQSLLVDEIIVYEDAFKGVVGRLRLARRLRRKRFSKAVLLQNAFDAALLSFLAGIPERIGYDRDGRGRLLTKSVPYANDDRKIHHIHYYLNLLAAAGIGHAELNEGFFTRDITEARVDLSYPWIHLSAEERLNGRARLSGLSRPVLGINPGATYGSAKRWVPERFAEIAAWFVRDTGGSVVVFGSSPEAETAEDICAKAEYGLSAADKGALAERNPQSVLNLAGQTSLRDLIVLISECDVFLSNDSGPLHIAYAVGTPVVAIFGSTDPALTGPVGPGNRVIRTNISCSPCFDRTCRNKDLRCMYTVTSEEVYHGIKEVLPRKRAIFLDRDGTLCEDANYLSDWDAFKVFGDVGSLALLKERGFLLIGITNQSGIRRGLVREPFVEEVNRLFIEQYGFDAFYYCPHHPDEHCPCRKPETGMLCNARYSHGVDFKRSYVIGDKDDDMVLAQAVGAKGILVKTGKDRESGRALFSAENLRDAVHFIIRNEEAST